MRGVFHGCANSFSQTAASRNCTSSKKAPALTQTQDLQGAQRQRALWLALAAAAAAAPILCLDRLAQVRRDELAAGPQAPSPAPTWRPYMGSAISERSRFCKDSEEAREALASKWRPACSLWGWGARRQDRHPEVPA